MQLPYLGQLGNEVLKLTCRRQPDKWQEQTPHPASLHPLHVEVGFEQLPYAHSHLPMKCRLFRSRSKDFTFASDFNADVTACACLLAAAVLNRSFKSDKGSPPPEIFSFSGIHDRIPLILSNFNSKMPSKT